ncbi:hypothetical protein [Streptomyces sp. ISL-11]|uniref:hypothetical protein n=1 Tax=Streptomyces sp. ISL-11 TaxID=2819174 RepID=UPI001BEBABCE|nr:hypothetical protein [Streptomyces sp. ISL-11]MBT2386931.1 hypothetical protein [Streptomyces sp. ISL-11]
MIKRIAAAAALTGAALTLTVTAASAAPMPQPPSSKAGDVVAPPKVDPPNSKDMSIYPGATNELNKLNQLNQLGQAAQALDPVLGLLSPLAGVLPL